MDETISSHTLSEANNYCKRILPKVSRTFALNINVLHGELYRAVLCGYLMCRIADTFEDSASLEDTLKIQLLQNFSFLFNHDVIQNYQMEQLKEPFRFKEQLHPYYHLILNCEKVFINYLNLRLEFRQAIRDCVQEMCQGMIAAIQEQKDKSFSIITFKDLDNYCYYVAGTVGKLLTRLFAAYSKNIPTQLQFEMQNKEVAFGLGLQITNIIKDSHKDYKRGWCYIPVELANRYGLPIKSFFEDAHNEQAMMALNDLVEKAVSHLDDALAYTLLIPRKEMRMRLFCLWPLLFAMETLVVAKDNRNLVTGHKSIKITRHTVSRVIYLSSLFFWNNGWIKYIYRKLRNKIIKP